MKRLAEHLVEGQVVLHCGEWVELLAVRVADGIVTAIAASGGRVSFPIGALVRVRRT